MLEKIKVLFFVLVGVLFFTLADVFVVDAATVNSIDNVSMVKGIDVSYYTNSYPYYIAYRNTSTNKLLFFFCNAPLSVSTSGSYWTIYTTQACSYACLEAVDNGSSWSSQAFGSPNGALSTGHEIEFTATVFSNHDVKEHNAANVVFMGPPPPTRLQIATEGIQMTGVMKEILALVPLLIPFLACFLGLKKALRMLSGILRKA